MRKKLIAAAGALVLSGCTAVPVAHHFPASDQPIAMSASHWQVIARSSAAHLKGSIGDGGSVTLAEAGASDFEKAFGGMLATALTDTGVAVERGAVGSLRPTLSYSVQVIRHGHGIVRHPARLGFLGAVAGSAVWAVDAGWPGVAAAPFIGAGLGAMATGIAGYLPDSPGDEIVVTTALTRDGMDVSRTTGVFYVQSSDIGEYSPPPPPPIVVSPLVTVPVRQR